MGCAVALVVDGLLEQRHADAHDDCSGDLVGAGVRVDDAAAVDDGDDAADAKLCDAGCHSISANCAPKLWVEKLLASGSAPRPPDLPSPLALADVGHA